MESYVLRDQNIRVKCDKCLHELLSLSDPLEINDDGNGDDIDCSHGNGVDNENDDWDNTIFILPHPLCSNPKWPLIQCHILFCSRDDFGAALHVNSW